MGRILFVIVYVLLSALPVFGGDGDDDGVKNRDDVCPATDLAQFVMVGSCNAGFVDVVDREDGCSLNQDITLCICAASGSCAGLTLEDRVKQCIRHVANSFHDQGLI